MTSDHLSLNHIAFGAVDDAGNGYIILQPVDPNDHRFSRVAIPLPSGGLAQAERHAESFNKGEVWAFSGAGLRGDQIPSLHRPVPTWKQCTIPYGANYELIQTAAANLHLLDTAIQRRVSSRFALFIRDEGYEQHVLLLSPELASYVGRIPGEWADALSPTSHSWALLYGDVRSHEELGLTPPSISD